MKIIDFMLDEFVGKVVILPWRSEMAYTNDHNMSYLCRFYYAYGPFVAYMLT
jgi:hypothetical protein